MQDLTKFLYLLETTRNMPQYGYSLSGGNSRLGNLAEHHYLVTMIAWQLAKKAEQAGGEIDVEKVLEFALIHDLGEIFGSDISMPYAAANPKAKKAAKAFEDENNKFLSQFFSGDEDYYKQMLKEILDSKSDEAHIAKIADYIEITTYKQYTDKFSKKDVALIEKKIDSKVKNIRDKRTKEEMRGFTKKWLEEISDFDNFDLKIKEIFGF